MAVFLFRAAPPSSPPANTVAPAITGTPQENGSLTCSTGSWSNSPTGYTYQWKRATTSGGTYSNISGATASTYVPVTGDVTYYIDCVVTASNGAGAGSPVTAAYVGPVTALSDPTGLPLLAKSNVTLNRYFNLPSGTNYEFGNSIGVSADGASMYATGNGGGGNPLGLSVYKFAIPSTNGATATVATALTAITGDVNPGDSNARPLGGLFEYSGRLIVSSYAYYDGTTSAVLSHKSVATNLGSQDSDYCRVGSLNVGFYAGYMGTIPTAWQTLFGAPAVTGCCNLAINSRTSSGPSLHAFNPASIDGSLTAVSASPMVAYPNTNKLADEDTPNIYYHWADRFSGVMFPSGTRSVWFIGHHGYGTGPYYGSNAATPGNNGDAGGDPYYCWDPVLNGKGSHAYPYKFSVWAYDANDLLAVKAGTKNSWEPIPTMIDFDLIGDGTTDMAPNIGGATYCEATRQLFLLVRYYTDSACKVYVFDVATP